MTANPVTLGLIRAAAADIPVNAQWLVELINFETAGTFSPTIKNERSSARGLLQFTDATARTLGFSDSSALVKELNTVSAQLAHAVIPYLIQYAPFPSEQSLYMSVFYPTARDWPPSAAFPANVQAANPHIKTVADYLSLVKKKPINYNWLIVAIVLSIGAYLLTKKERGKQ